jgi:hypothetical protein
VRAAGAGETPEPPGLTALAPCACAEDVPALPGLDEDPEVVKKAAVKEAADKAAARRRTEGGREAPEDR